MMSDYADEKRSHLDVYTWLPSYGEYQATQVLGKYLFLMFTKDKFAGSDPTPDFLDGVDILLADDGKSLPDNDYQRMPNLYKTRVLGGWYNTMSRTYGYAHIQVQPSTSSRDGLGSLFFFNDAIGVGHSSDKWVIAHWKDSGTDLYVTFAHANDPPIFLGVSILTFDPTGPHDDYDRYEGLNPSRRFPVTGGVAKQ